MKDPQKALIVREYKLCHTLAKVYVLLLQQNAAVGQGNHLQMIYGSCTGTPAENVDCNKQQEKLGTCAFVHIWMWYVGMFDFKSN